MKTNFLVKISSFFSVTSLKRGSNDLKRTTKLVRILLFSLLFFGLGYSLQAQVVLQKRTSSQLKSFYKARELNAPQAVKLQLNTLRTEIKQKKLSYKVGYTAVFERPPSQLFGELEVMPVQEVNAIKAEMLSKTFEEFRVFADTDGLPSAYDARDHGWVSPVVDQGGCGSCWAFAAVAMYESNYLKRNNTLALASEQYALNCSGGGSCGGGLSYKVFRWMVDNNKNLKKKSGMPYVGSKGTCPTGSVPTNYYANSWTVLRPDKDISKIADPALIKNAIMQYGAVKSSLVASGWSGYSSGVLDGYPSNYSSPSSNHAILIVGWDNSKQAFLVKNSWGTDWGYDGFCWVKYGNFNIGRRAIVVTAKKSYSAITKVFKGKDNGMYYVREIGSKVFWFGEAPNGGFANVFIGNRSGNYITGNWADVPKGKAKNKGVLKFKVSTNGKKLTKISQTGGFSCSSWVEASLPANTYGAKSAGFKSNSITNLDGLWKCNDKGNYYINQVGNKVFWFGEATFTSGKPTFANVAYGTRSGNNLTLKWADVPKCNMGGKGTLKLKVTSANTMVKTSGSGFGGSKWSRMNILQIKPLKKVVKPTKRVIKDPKKIRLIK